MGKFNDIWKDVGKNNGVTFERADDGVRKVQHMEGYIIGIKSVGTINEKIVKNNIDIFNLARRMVNQEIGKMGIWKNDGVYYVDLVEHTFDKEYALRVAKERGELAIYDCENGREIIIEKANNKSIFSSVYKKVENGLTEIVEEKTNNVREI